MYVRLKLAGLLLWVDLMQMSRLLMYKYGLVRVCVRACCTLIDVIKRGTKRTQRKKMESYAAVECLPVSSLQHMATELKSVISGTFYFNIIYLCVCVFFFIILAVRSTLITVMCTCDTYVPCIGVLLFCTYIYMCGRYIVGIAPLRGWTKNLGNLSKNNKTRVDARVNE